MNYRWHLKKVARRTISFGTLSSGSLHLRRALRPNVVRALTYHRFVNEPQQAFSVCPGEFDKQMALLRKEGRAISVEQLQRFVRQEGATSPDACLVTIDDGMHSVLTGAYPALDRWQVPAVLFVCSNLIGRQVPGAAERYLSWSELRSLTESGLLTIGSHAHTHRSLGTMKPAEAKQEIVRSKEVLEDNLGREVTAFAYPFGTRGDFNERTKEMLMEAGYSVGFTSIHGAIRPGGDPLSLPRAKVEGGESLRMFKQISRGSMDPWALVDNNLWRLQRVRSEIA